MLCFLGRKNSPANFSKKKLLQSGSVSVVEISFFAYNRAMFSAATQLSRAVAPSGILPARKQSLDCARTVWCVRRQTLRWEWASLVPSRPHSRQEARRSAATCASTASCIARETAGRAFDNRSLSDVLERSQEVCNIE